MTDTTVVTCFECGREMRVTQEGTLAHRVGDKWGCAECRDNAFFSGSRDRLCDCQNFYCQDELLPEDFDALRLHIHERMDVIKEAVIAVYENPSLDASNYLLDLIELLKWESTVASEEWAMWKDDAPEAYRALQHEITEFVRVTTLDAASVPNSEAAEALYREALENIRLYERIYRTQSEAVSREDADVLFQAKDYIYSYWKAKGLTDNAAASAAALDITAASSR